MGICKWCHGRGWDSVEGGRRFDCPDCDGRGYIDECDHCGQEYTGELAEAINDKQSIDHLREEAAHVAVTAIRFLEMLEK